MASLYDMYHAEGGEEWEEVADKMATAVATAYVTSKGNPRMRKILEYMVTTGWDNALRGDRERSG